MPDNLQSAQWWEILPILRQTHRIWSTGLNGSIYNDYIRLQTTLPWARSNFRYLTYRHRGEIVSSCKLYSVQLSARGKLYKLAGVGAVFTQFEHQGLGYGSKLIKAVTKYAKQNNYDGLLLYSEIEAEFYQRLGFELMGCDNFSLSVDHLNSSQIADVVAETAPLEVNHLDWICRHYQRWLARQPFGYYRNRQYLAFRLARESYLHQFSSLAWPQLEILKLDSAETGQGYAIFEFADKTLRVLEAVCLPQYQEQLWNQLLTVAQNRQAKYVRGWESVKPQELALKSYQRHWGWPMLLPLNPEINPWRDIQPCPLLELDHF